MKKDALWGKDQHPWAPHRIPHAPILRITGKIPTLSLTMGVANGKNPTLSSRPPIFMDIPVKWLAMAGYGGLQVKTPIFCGLTHCFHHLSTFLWTPAPHRPQESWSPPASSWSWPPLLGPRHPGRWPGYGSHTAATMLRSAAPSSIAFFMASNCLTLLVWFSPSLANKYTSCGGPRHQSVVRIEDPPQD